MALPNTTVEIAFDSGYSTAAASRTWTDVSTYVEGAYPLTVGRGRSDEVSEVQPSRLALVLDNADGRFTPRLASGAYYPDVKKGRPVRVTVTYNAVDYVRYVGYVSEWPVSWPDGTSAACVVNLTSASRMARLGRGAELRSAPEEEILQYSPYAYYLLSEPADSTSAVDSSGNQWPTLTMTGSGTDVVFGNAIGPGTDGLTAAEFAGGKYLAEPVERTTSAVTAGILCAFSTTVGGSLITHRLGNPSPLLDVSPSTGNLRSPFYSLAAAGDVRDGATHVAEWRCDGANVYLYLDGVLVGSTAGVLPSSFTRLSVGEGTTGVFTGTIAHVALLSSDPGDAGAADRADALLTGNAGELSGARIIRLAGYASIPTAEVAADTGDSTIGHFDTTGMTPIAAMAKVVETENGVLYDAKGGDLSFDGRDARYNLTSAFSLSVTAQEVEADLEPKDDDQFLVNDVTASANGVPAGRVVDTTSRDENGTYSKSLDTVTDDTSDALAGAQWAVYQGKDPEPRYSSVTVDITNSSTAQAAAVLAADIGTKFTLTNLPDQAPGSSVDLFVEGYNETITATRHTITFNTSPADGYDVWTIEDAVFGQYDAYPIAF